MASKLGSTALVTGSTSGTGRANANRLADTGLQVIASGRRSGPGEDA